MAALFALGEMSLTWMTVIAAVIAVQKLAPYRRLTSSGAAILLGCARSRSSDSANTRSGVDHPGQSSTDARDGNVDARGARTQPNCHGHDGCEATRHAPIGVGQQVGRAGIWNRLMRVRALPPELANSAVPGRRHSNPHDTHGRRDKQECRDQKEDRRHFTPSRSRSSSASEWTALCSSPGTGSDSGARCQRASCCR
jgi:hypothetical protein